MTDLHDNHKGKSKTSKSSLVISAAWYCSPKESSGLYTPVFGAVSIAMQTFLRQRLPEIYFADRERLNDVALAYPMMIYAASRPYKPYVRTDMAYDVLRPNWLERVMEGTRLGIMAQMEKIHAQLVAEGATELAESYHRYYYPYAIEALHKMRKSQRMLLELVAGEAYLIGDLQKLAGLGRMTPPERARRVERFAKAWKRHVRRLCRGVDLGDTGDELLQVATRALTEAIDRVAA